jgi:hypothetical protein
MGFEARKKQCRIQMLVDDSDGKLGQIEASVLDCWLGVTGRLGDEFHPPS